MTTSVGMTKAKHSSHPVLVGEYYHIRLVSTISTNGSPKKKKKKKKEKKTFNNINKKKIVIKHSHVHDLGSYARNNNKNELTFLANDRDNHLSSRPCFPDRKLL